MTFEKKANNNEHWWWTHDDDDVINNTNKIRKRNWIKYKNGKKKEKKSLLFWIVNEIL